VATVDLPTSGPPTYVGGYMAWPFFGASPPRSLLSTDVFIIHHADDFTAVRINQKTYRRLFGMIFFEGFGTLLIPYLQWFATLKVSKNRKKSKAKYHFYFAKHRFSCQNAPKTACFSVSTKTLRATCLVSYCGIGYCVDSWNHHFLA
jgi:hypothetical protein